MSTPIGTIAAWGGIKEGLPADWLFCDGTSYPVASYIALHNVIGDSWGGDGGTNFNVPDLRGYFLRGVDEGVGVDGEADNRQASYQASNPPPNPGNTGDNVGSYEPDQVGPHDNQFQIQYDTEQQNVPVLAGYNMNNILGGYLGGSPSSWTVLAPSSPALLETTVKNKSVYFIICCGSS